MAQSLNQNREEGQSTLSAEAVLEQLLRGELSLVSQTARGHIIIAADEINYQQNQALSGQEAPSNATAQMPSSNSLHQRPLLRQNRQP